MLHAYVHNSKLKNAAIRMVFQYGSHISSNFNETHLDTLLIIVTSFHFCELEGIFVVFPSGPNNAITWTNDWIMLIGTIEM